MNLWKITVETYFPWKENLLDRNSLIVETGANKHLSEKYSINELIVRAINWKFNEIVKPDSDYLKHCKLDWNIEAYDTRKVEMIQSMANYIINSLKKKDSDYINKFLVKIVNLKYIWDYAINLLEKRTEDSLKTERDILPFIQTPDHLWEIQTLIFSFFLKNNIYSSKTVSEIYFDHWETISDYKKKWSEKIDELLLEIEKIGKKSEKERKKQEAKTPY